MTGWNAYRRKGNDEGNKGRNEKNVREEVDTQSSICKGLEVEGEGRVSIRDEAFLFFDCELLF